METTPNEAWKRIETVMEISGEKTVNAFAKMIGILRTERLYRIRNGKNSISKSLANRIHEHFPQFSVAWLTYGGDNPPQYLKFKANDRLVMIPLYDGIDTLKTEHYIYLPDDLTNGAEMAVYIKDNVFSPYCRNGSMLLMKSTEYCTDYGKIYLVRADGINALYELRPAATRGKLSLKPTTGDTSDEIAIDAASVTALYAVTGIFIL